MMVRAIWSFWFQLADAKHQTRMCILERKQDDGENLNLDRISEYVCQCSQSSYTSVAQHALFSFNEDILTHFNNFFCLAH